MPTGSPPVSLAAALAAADHAPHQVAAYAKALARIHGCSRSAAAGYANQGAGRLAAAKLPDDSRLAVLKELAVATKALKTGCAPAYDAYLSELKVHRSQTSSGWGGYAGSLDAFEAAHHAYPGRSGAFLPKLPNGDATYQVYSGSPVTGMFRRFDPPVSQPVALAVVLRDLVPAPVHPVYSLHAAECQQEVYLGKALGELTGSSSEGVFVELSSGKGVGKSPYDARSVDQARLTPGGAIGGQPCT